MALAVGESVVILVDRQRIEADLEVPENAVGLVIFAHGSGSSRFSPRNAAVAECLQQRGFGTLMLDLLTREEEVVDEETREHRFDVERLAERVAFATDWVRHHHDLRSLPIGYFGASTGAAAALIAAANRPDTVRAIVSRGGRPDLAADALPKVAAPTLLIVGAYDEQVLALNRHAISLMKATVQLEVVPGATHLFEELGALEQVEQMACDWFAKYLGQ